VNSDVLAWLSLRAAAKARLWRAQACRIWSLSRHEGLWPAWARPRLRPRLIGEIILYSEDRDDVYKKLFNKILVIASRTKSTEMGSGTVMVGRMDKRVHYWQQYASYSKVLFVWDVQQFSWAQVFFFVTEVGLNFFLKFITVQYIQWLGKSIAPHDVMLLTTHNTWTKVYPEVLYSQIERLIY